MQKVSIFLSSIVVCSLALGSCKKELTTKVSGTASLTIVNGVVGNNYFFTNFNGDKGATQSYSGVFSIGYGRTSFFNSYSGQQILGLYQAPDTNATSKPVIKLTLDLPVNTTHTLFLMGTPQDPDQLFTTDDLPYHPPTDSSMSIRFVNISKGSAPVTVNLAGQANGSEAQNLSYKNVTAFKKYNAGSAINSYTFQFRDIASGNLLGSCIIDGINNNGSPTAQNLRRYHNFTIAFLGAAGGLATKRVLIIDGNIHY